MGRYRIKICDLSYLCNLRPHSIQTALKILNKRLVGKKWDYARRHIRREATMLMRLEHPNIIYLYEILETPNHFYLVTELVQDIGLKRHIKRRSERVACKGEGWGCYVYKGRVECRGIWAVSVTEHWHSNLFFFHRNNFYSHVYKIQQQKNNKTYIII